MSAVVETYSPDSTIGNTSPASSDNRSLPAAGSPGKLKRVATKDDSSDEGTLGYASTTSQLSRDSLTNSGLCTRRSTSKAAFHERSGLWILPLSEVETDEAVAMYLNLQSNGLLFKKMGLQGQSLREYAEFHVRIGQAEPWNMCAIDENGKVAGMCIYVRTTTSIDASDLNPLALDHWRIFIELEKSYASRTGIDTSDHMCCTFIGMMPEFQGKGLMGEMQMRMADTAFENDFRRFWSWTINPNVLKAMGAGDGGIHYAVRLAEILFTVPPWVSNNIFMNFFSVTGLVPKGLRALWIPLPSLGIESVEKAAAGLNPCVSANVIMTTAKYTAQRAHKKGAAAQARSRLVMSVIALVVLLVALYAARH